MPHPSILEEYDPRNYNGFGKMAIISIIFARNNHTFSAFWLRSSVVSVLISLISGTSTIVGYEY